MWLEANHLEAKGLQQIEFAVAGLATEGLYDLIPGAVAQVDLSVSVGLPLPKKQNWVAKATISGPTAQESEANSSQA